MIFRNGYNYDVDQASLESGLECKDPSLTSQSSADEADINTLVRRFGLTGTMPQGLKVPEYGDFDVVMDFQSAQNAVLAAQKSFMAMPADVRARFVNDPQVFLEFCANPENADELVKMGLAIKKDPVIVPTPDVPA